MSRSDEIRWDGLSWVEQTLHAAERQLDLRLTLYDLTGLFHDAHGRSLLAPLRTTHRNRPACSIGYDRSRCIAHCRGDIIEHAMVTTEPFRRTCWKGLEEIVVPLWWETTLIAVLLAGSWRTTQAIAESREDLPAAFATTRTKLPALTRQRERELSALLPALGHGLLLRLDSAALQSAGEKPLSRREIILRFLRYQACGRNTLGDLAQALHLTESRTSHVVRELFGRSFQQLVKEERIRRAQVLLQSTDLSVNEIAARVGVDNPYHFNALFKSAVGQPPGRFRNRFTAEQSAGSKRRPNPTTR